MNKFLMQALSLALLLIGCGEKNEKEIDKPETDTPVNLKIKDSEYQTYFVCEKGNLERLKKDLTAFGQHVDYKDTLLVNFYDYNNHYVVAFPQDLTVGQAAFLTSWLEYGFTLTKNKINPDKDLFFYNEENLLKQDFVGSFFRDNSVSFKTNIINASFEGINNVSYNYKNNSDLSEKLKAVIPSSFKLREAKLIELKYILEKLKPIEPYIDSTKSKDKTVQA